MVLLFMSSILVACHSVSQIIVDANKSKESPLARIENESSRSTPQPTRTISKPSATQTTIECTNTNIMPTDLPKYRNITSNAGLLYKVSDITGHLQNPSSRYSLGGQIFGPMNSSNSNSWTYCVTECLDWCDKNSSCHSFNVFSFEENDYPPNSSLACEVTCECRPVRRHYDQSDYGVSLPPSSQSQWY